MGAAKKSAEVYSVTEDAPTSAEDAVYTATTKVGEGAYVAITKLMNLDQADAEHTTIPDDGVPASNKQFKSGFRPRLDVPIAVDKSRETLPAPPDDGESIEATSVLARPWLAPSLPIAAPQSEIDPPRLECPPTPNVPIIVEAPPAIVMEASPIVPPSAPPAVSESRTREVVVFAVAFLTTLLPAAIYLLAR